MKQAIFHLKRDTYRGDTTLGILYDPSGKQFCYVLEDVVRAYGIKDKKRTAIPSTVDDFTYKMTIRTSPEYGEVVVIYTSEKDGMYYLDYGGISYQMILAHGGNDAEDTDGCLLVNKNRDTDEMTAWGSQKEVIKEAVKALEKEGYDVRLRITNLPQEA